MRLDKYLCRALGKSRSDISKIIKDRLIKVNNKIIIQKDYSIDELVDKIYYQDELLTYREFVYFMLNKPQGYVSAVVDNIDKTVVELINTTYDIFPVGRLDKDTEGLLILTNNGKLAHKLTSPNHNVVKKYYAILNEEVNNFLDLQEKFNEGIYIYDGNKNRFKTKKAEVEKINSNEYYIYITEGKYHQVKKMFLALGYKVEYLKRISMGTIELDNNLQVGQYRLLTDDEITKLKEL